jgi:hypothetical protein
LTFKFLCRISATSLRNKHNFTTSICTGTKILSAAPICSRRAAQLLRKKGSCATFSFKTAHIFVTRPRRENKNVSRYLLRRLLEVELMQASCGTKKVQLCNKLFSGVFEFHFEDRKTCFCYTFLSYFSFSSCFFFLLNLDAIYIKIIHDSWWCNIGSNYAALAIVNISLSTTLLLTVSLALNNC